MPQVTKVELAAAVFYLLMAIVAAYFLFRSSSPNLAPVRQTGQAVPAGQQTADLSGYAGQFRISVPANNETAGTTVEMIIE